MLALGARVGVKRGRECLGKADTMGNCEVPPDREGAEAARFLL